MFLVAAVVPMLFTAGIASYEFNRGLEQEAERELRSSAKEYGIEILTRLQDASDKAQEIMRIAGHEGVESVPGHDYLTDNFEAVGVVTDDGMLALPQDATDESIVISADHYKRLEAGLPSLLLTPQGNLILLLSAGNGLPAEAAAFQLNAEQVWGPRENLPANTEFCVFSESGQRLYCTSTLGEEVHSALLDKAGDRTRVFGEWLHDDQAHYASLWHLFLDGSFGAPGIDIVAMQPKLLMLATGADFRRVLIPATALILVLVALLSFNLIGRSLVPLHHLTIASRQIAGGNLESRVRIKTGDEFEWLAEAFNDMASRLARQISALEAMAGIDRMILSGTRFEDVAVDVVEHLVDLLDCSSAAVIACDFNDPRRAQMVSTHKDKVHQEIIELPGGANHDWCQPRQVVLAEIDEADAPYKPRFESYGQRFVVLVPVILYQQLKGVLMLGFDSEFEMSNRNLQAVADLAGRFAVALSSVEREEQLYRQANFDALTGLPNRQLLKERMERHIERARDENQRGALLFLDLDRFKEINDIFGHSVGDAVLLQAAQRIVAEVRNKDAVARLGGDEFVVILPDMRDVLVPQATAQRLLECLSEAFTVDEVDHYLGASIGIVIYPEDGDSVETLLKNADGAMYRAKEAGRNRYEFFSHRLNVRSRRKIDLERALRQALREEALEVHYQPLFDIGSGTISGAEALIRWNHPLEGPISPSEFIPLAEESSLIIELGAWVIRRACEDLARIVDHGLHPGPVSINVSPHQLRDRNFDKVVMRSVRRAGIVPGYLQLELTETAVAQNRDKAITLLQTLRNAGVRVAIDDFGTGYSSLSYLQQMPFDVIKIDRSFVNEISTNETSANICRTIIRMAEEMGKTSSAEGVETREQLDILRKDGCDLAQGHFFSRALPIDEFIEFVAKQDFHTQRRKALEIL